MGSDGSAAGGRGSDLSEWPRSIKSRISASPKILSGTATGGIGRHSLPIGNQFNKCGRGGIGRHVGFRFQWATVQVQVLSPVPNKKERLSLSFLFFNLSFEKGNGLNQASLHSRPKPLNNNYAFIFSTILTKILFPGQYISARRILCFI